MVRYKMKEKTKKIILAIEFVILILLSVFVASIFAGNLGNKTLIATASAQVTSGEVPLVVNFKASVFDNEGAVASYRWDFGDGTKSELKNPTHIYQKSGTFIATLTVTDDKGAIGTNKITIDAKENISSKTSQTTLIDSSSDYRFTYFTWTPQYPDVGEKIIFSSTHYYYSYGEITYEMWDFGDGTKGWGPVVSHTYNKKGKFTVSLTVFGIDYSTGNPINAHSINYITVGASPFPRFKYSADQPTIGETINFDASESWDTNGQIVQYSWSYIDESEPNKLIEMGSGKTISYKFDKQGNYKVKLSVTDDEDNTNEITKTVVVSILKIEKVTGGFRHVVLQITNRGNFTANNIQWEVYVNRKILFIPLWKIFYKSGTIQKIDPGQTISIDIGRYRRGFGRITMTVNVEASNAVKISESLQGFMVNKYVRLRN